jgi:four helix bundle protein
MNKIELEIRTKQFSLQLIRFLESLPKNYLGETLGRQLLKSGTSIGANYREANRVESKADFIHKLAIVEKEASETLYWLELMLEGGIGGNQEAIKLMQEAKQLLAIFTAAGKNIERMQMISNLKFRNPKSMSSQI